MTLPEDFISYTRELFGEERWQRYLDAFNEEVPVSIRLNPFKRSEATSDEESAHLFPLPLLRGEGQGWEAVPWCRNAYYLKERPSFTLDPLLHAGAYYVQEAASMFLDEVLRQNTPQAPLEGGCRYSPNPSFSALKAERPSAERGGMYLDLCAAPGGKSTLMRAALPDDAMLFSNEPDRRRANILMENMQKQGHRNVIVTNNYPRDYRKAGLMFDAILCDVPCSGEGMFRKDEGTIKEWSLQNVMKCQELQRSIVEEIWSCLKPGGLLIYSTCTFNTREDEENVRWIMEELGADILSVETKAEWNITGSLLKGWDKPVYRFIPGTTRGEGLFMAVLKKALPPRPLHGGGENTDNPSIEQYTSLSDGRGKGDYHTSLPSYGRGKGEGPLRILSDGHPQGTVKGKNIIPAHAEALLAENVGGERYPYVELTLDDALRYLHHEALVLPPDTPKGFVIVTYQGLPLGFVKNIGNRANNLYPQEWKIRNL